MLLPGCRVPNRLVSQLIMAVDRSAEILDSDRMAKTGTITIHFNALLFALLINKSINQ